jgi:hypothetical protein
MQPLAFGNAVGGFGTRVTGGITNEFIVYTQTINSIYVVGQKNVCPKERNSL